MSSAASGTTRSTRCTSGTVCESQRVGLPLHQAHVLRLRAERQRSARFVIAHDLRDPGILLRRADPIVRPDIIDLAVQRVGPIEHLCDFWSELPPVRSYCSFIERNTGRMAQQRR